MRLVKSPLRASSTSEARGLIASLLLVALLYGRGLGHGFVREGEEAFVLEIHLLCRFAVVEQHFVPARGLQAADPRIN